MIKLEGYKTIKKIASGGMGDVFLAEHLKLKKKVAIKSLHKNLVNNIDFRKRFEKEAQTHAKLDHPNIVKLLDFKERKDGLFLIMEYVNGKTLDEHVKIVSGPIPENELATLYTQVLNAIGYAHDKGLVHRDIKPDNIMIDENGNIKILDFGIAKMNEDDSGLTKTGIQIGTATYMSPEQVDAKKVDMLSDIYSLGVTLFYLAVGKSPYSDVTNTYRIQEKIMKEPFPLASDFYPAVSKKLQEIILKATQKKKSDRYQSSNEFLYKLKKITTQKVNNKTETQDIISNNTKSSSKGLSPRLKIIWTLVLLLIISILFYFSSDLQFNDTNNSEKVIADSSLNVPLKIGDFYEGGVVFYIEKKGDYALVCDVNDLGKAKFGSIGFYAWKDSPDSIGSGEKNTNYWANITPSDAEAALLCKKSSNKGYTDWFLPSIDELKEMHNNKSLIDSISLLNGGSIFLDQYYWSSSADNLTNDCTEKINFNLEPTATYPNPYYEEELLDSSRRSGYREQINNVRAIRIVKGFFVEGKSTKERVSVDTTSNNEISEEKAIREKAEREKAEREKAEREKADFMSISNQYFKDNVLTKKGRFFISKLLEKNYNWYFPSQGDTTWVTADSVLTGSEILLIDNKYVVFIDYNKIRFFNIWNEHLLNIVSNEYVGESNYSRFEISDFVFSTSLELHPATVSWYFSKSSNVLCSDQGLILSGMWRKHYFHFPSIKNIENIVVEDGEIPYFENGIALHTISFSEFSKFLSKYCYWCNINNTSMDLPEDLKEIKILKWD